MRASAAKGQIICKAKRSSARKNFAKQQARKSANRFSNRLWALHAKTAERRRSANHLFYPLFNSPICTLKHRLHMPSLASSPASKGCPAADGFSISNKNRARHFSPLAPAQRPRATLPCLTASPSLNYRETIAGVRTA